jgi:apolipoprotein N-acyltransferase
MLAGWAYFVPTLSWSGTYVGALPWGALATLQALYVAVMSALVGWASRRLLAGTENSRLCSFGGVRAGGGRFGAWAAYLLIPLGWVAQELARSTTPWGGAPGVTFVTALLGMLLLVGALALTRRRRVTAIAAAVALGLLLILPGVAIPPEVHYAVSVSERIGLIQGNVPKAGLDFNAERRAVLDNHVRGTETFAAQARQNGWKDLSLVVWPENSSDIDPFRNTDAAAQIQRAVDAVDVPLVVGAVLAEPVGHNSNVSLLYRPGGGEPERYTKVHPVPFAEYIPYRDFFSRFSSAAELAGNFVAGDEIGVFEVQGSAPGRGTATDKAYAVLPTICFEVAYDGLIRDSVAAAGSTPSVLLVQTNNATFGFSAESEQQFAISRLRAVEHGRHVVHVSTVGVSGFIDDRGRVTGKTGLFTAEQRAGLVQPMAQSSLADRLGSWPERGAVLGFVVLLGLALTRRADRKRATQPAR